MLRQLDLTKPLPEGADLAAEALLANHTLMFETANSVAGSDLASEFRIMLDGQLNPSRKVLARYLDNHTELPTTQPEIASLLAGEGIDFNALRDPWGQPYTLVLRHENRGTANLELHTDGPDKQHATSDDFDIPLGNWQWFAGHLRELREAVVDYHQRTGRFRP